MSRLLSYSEVSTALNCQARWDFRYSDHLAGSSLKEKTIVPMLSGGRAWGQAVAAWHTHAGQAECGEMAVAAMDESLERDAAEQREHGVHDQEQHDQLRLELLQMLVHYTDTAEQVKMEPITERELLIPIPSRTGQRPSNRYKLLCYLDAEEVDEDGYVWLDEFKLRGQLTSVQQITLSRQIRWYAYAYEQATGNTVRGVWVNERLREAPKPARILKSGRASHAVNQLCTEEAYEAACRETEEEPNPDTISALRQRRWQQRVPVMFRAGELEEVGSELVSAAKLIHLLESGELLPLRNVSRWCGSCQYRDICPSPDTDLVDALFTRQPPKRDMVPTQ